MILKQLIASNRSNTSLTAIVLLSVALVAFGVGPTTRPIAQPGDPVSALRNALPKGWSLQGPMRLKRRDMNPGPQWSRVPAKYMKLRSRLVPTKDGLQREAPPVIVWLAQRQADKAPPRAAEDQQDVEQKPTEYLGSGAGNHIYLHLPTGAAKLWPTARADIAKALGVKLATTQPGDKTPEGSIVTVTLNGATVSFAFDGIACANTKAVAQAIGKMSKDSPLVIQIETNVPSSTVMEILSSAQKHGLQHISITVTRTSRPAPVRKR